MIQTFSFKNFLSFKEKTIFSLERQATDDSHKDSFSKIQNVDLLKSAVIYGANASGKSNFTKAFVFFYNLITKGLLFALENSPIPTAPFLLSSKADDDPSFFEIEIIAHAKKFVYGFEVSSKKVLNEWLYQYPNKKILFKRSGDEINSNRRYFKEATAELKKQTRSNVLFLTLLASHNGSIANEVVEEINKIVVFPADQKDMILEYAFQNYEKYKDDVWELLKEADFGIKALRIEQNEVSKEEFERPIPPQLREVMTTGKDKFYYRKASTIHLKYDDKGREVGEVVFDFITQESAGTRQMFALSVLFVDALKEGKTLLLDELNSSLHPLLCRFMMKIFNSKKQNPNNAQLIFTTHDVNLLDSGILRRDQIFFVEKDKYGASKLFSLSELGERKELSYYKRYFEGRYGALPYIKSLESNEEQWN